jgi:hypothetical protein
MGETIRITGRDPRKDYRYAVYERMYPDFSLRLLATFASGRIFLTFLHKRYRKEGFAALDV